MVKNTGSTLAIVLMFLALMLMLVLGLHHNTMMQIHSVANYTDYDLATNYAKDALLDAEKKIMQLQCANTSGEYDCLAMDKVTSIDPSFECIGANSVTNLRLCKFKNLSINGLKLNALTSGASCNKSNTALKGFCIVADSSSNPQNVVNKKLFTKIDNVSNKEPCATYTKDSAGISWLDYKDNSYTISYQTANSLLCAQPRYMIEVLNLDFHGGEVNESNYYLATPLSQDKGVILAGSNESGIIIPSGIIYRITARAFGKNGNTRVTMQEYLLLNPNVDAENKYLHLIPLSINTL